MNREIRVWGSAASGGRTTVNGESGERRTALPRAVFGEETGAKLRSRERQDARCRREPGKLRGRGNQRRPGVSNSLAKKANRVIVRRQSRATLQLEGALQGGISNLRDMPVTRACCGKTMDMSLRDIALESRSGQNQRDENASGHRQPRAAVTTAAANRSECRRAQAGGSPVDT
jgi:hypothetical protein